MAIWGLSVPVCGEYSASGNTVTYENAFICNKAVEYSTSIEAGDDNNFYADNGIAESETSFKSGELTLKTADLPQELSKKILGTHIYTQSYSVGGSSKTAEVNVYDEAAVSPYLGFGIIEGHINNNVKKYRAVFLNKIQFSIPDNAATTKGDSIDWQTPELKASIFRSDEVRVETISSTDTIVADHPWMEDAWFNSESEAQAWLIYRCGGLA